MYQLTVGLGFAEASLATVAAAVASQTLLHTADPTSLHIHKHMHKHKI